MTGFGKGEHVNGEWRVVALLRSVNGRGLDISVRAPSYVMPLEQMIKDTVKKGVKRGTIHIFLEVESLKPRIPIDKDLLIGSVRLLKEIAVKDAGLNVDDSTLFQMAWKYSERTSVELDESLEEAVLSAVREGVKDLVESREREGRVLYEDLKRRAVRIGELTERISSVKDKVLERTRERVIERAKRLSLPEEHPTVLNEIVFVLERMDVEEEMTRLRSHVDRFLKALSEDGDVGKRLEFLAQEMHREITTLGNKIPDLSEFVVEIKTEIDRIKQQCANVE